MNYTYIIIAIIVIIYLIYLYQKSKSSESWVEMLENSLTDSEPKPKGKPKPTKIDINTVIGLETVKREITTLENFMRINRRKLILGIPTDQCESYHMVFTGNPGTGKTTMARYFGQVLFRNGVLKSGHVIEVDRQGLIAGYIGQTARKTQKVLESALDGVLFIDEAYSLMYATKDLGDYGAESIATILKFMEDFRSRIVVIVAGYRDEMKQFIHSNPGLLSRFSNVIDFPDYSVSELVKIGRQQLQEKNKVLVDPARKSLRGLLKRSKNNGNGRMVRNLVDQIIKNQANRLCQSEIATLTKENLAEIVPEDIPTDWIDHFGPKKPKKSLEELIEQFSHHT